MGQKEVRNMIAGLQKMTLLDYPGKVACTVFLQGCNFRCPFCHNSGLLCGPAETPISTEELLTFLKKRQGLLDGVCVTGGEPTLCRELPELLAAIKDLGFAVKLDTNGSRPQVLAELIGRGLVDYVAMDIKNSPDKYALTTGVQPDLAAIEESIRLLIDGKTDYEFRTTAVRELHTPEDFAEMGRWFEKIMPSKKPKKIYLQNYTDRESVLCGGLHSCEITQLQDFSAAIAPFVHSTEIRGEDQ